MDSILIITTLHEDGIRTFKCERNDSNTYQMLISKLRESSWIPLPGSGRRGVNWLFKDKRDEESFLEAFKWYILFE